MIHVLKSDGRIVSYQLNKVLQSIVKSLKTVNHEEQTIQLAAKEVIIELHEWLSNKNEITTNDIRATVSQSLEKINPEAASFYRHARTFD
jgi:transcriptional regulator NrdR family protein